MSGTRDAADLSRPVDRVREGGRGGFNPGTWRDYGGFVAGSSPFLSSQI